MTQPKGRRLYPVLGDAADGVVSYPWRPVRDPVLSPCMSPHLPPPQHDGCTSECSARGAEGTRAAGACSPLTRGPASPAGCAGWPPLRRYLYRTAQARLPAHIAMSARCGGQPLLTTRSRIPHAQIVALPGAQGGAPRAYAAGIPECSGWGQSEPPRRATTPTRWRSPQVTRRRRVPTLTSVRLHPSVRRVPTVHQHVLSRIPQPAEAYNLVLMAVRALLRVLAPPVG